MRTRGVGRVKQRTAFVCLFLRTRVLFYFFYAPAAYGRLGHAERGTLFVCLFLRPRSFF